MIKAKAPKLKVELPTATKALKESLKLPSDKTKWKVAKTTKARDEAEQRLAIDLYEHYGYKGAGYRKHKNAIEEPQPVKPVKPAQPAEKPKGKK